MRKIKPSHYNIIVTNTQGKTTLYNSISKAYIEIDESLLDADNLSMKKILELDEVDDIQLLSKLGFLINEDEDELEQIEYVYNKYYFNGTSLNIIITPTLACNFKCPYCFESGFESRWECKEDYFEVLKKYADKYFSLYNSIEISLFGGEPLLCKESIFSFLNYIEEKKLCKNLTISITTNGALIDNYVINNLNKFHCRAIQITIDGTEEKHNLNRIFKDNTKTFRLLIEKIKLLVKELDINTKIILRLNLKDVLPKEVKNTLEFFSREERKRISLLFRPIYQTNDYQEQNSSKLSDLNEYYKLGKNLGFSIVKNNYFYKTCEACGDDNFFYLMPDLSMWKCINDLSFNKARIGKINEKGEIKINASNLMYWNKLANCFSNSKCRECKLLPDCYGGCILYYAKNKERLCKEFSMSSLPYLYEDEL